MQLIIDLFECKPGLLDDPAAMTALLVKAQIELGFVAQEGGSAIWQTHAHGADGEAGHLQLVDGSLSVFTRVVTGTAWVDLFRLGDFDYLAVVGWFMAQMEAATANLQTIARGYQTTSPRPGPNAPWHLTERPA